MNLPRRAAAEIVILKQSEVAVTMEIEECAGTVGSRLAAARKAKGLSLLDIQAATKVKLAHLAAIEVGDRSALPATPFAAGFVKAYAQFLGLDPDQWAKAYRAEAGAEPPQASAASATPDGQPSPSTSIVGIRSTAAIATVEIDRPNAPITLAAAADRPEPAAALNAPSPPPAPPAAQEPLSPASAPRPAAQEQCAPSAPLDPPATPQEETLTLDGAGATLSPFATPATDKTFTRAGAALVAADRFVLYFGMGVAALVGGFIGANFFGEARAPAPVAVMPAPAAVVAPIKIEPPAPPPAPAVVAEPETPPPVVRAPALKPKPQKVAVAAPAPEPAPELLPEPAPVPAEPPAEIVPARMIRAAEPQYPDRCSRGSARTEEVEIVFDVTVDGRAANPSIGRSGNDCFNDAALDALRQMRFSPRTIGGEPAVEIGKRATIRFTR